MAIPVSSDVVAIDGNWCSRAAPDVMSAKKKIDRTLKLEQVMLRRGSHEGGICSVLRFAPFAVRPFSFLFLLDDCNDLASCQTSNLV